MSAKEAEEYPEHVRNANALGPAKVGVSLNNSGLHGGEEEEEEEEEEDEEDEDKLRERRRDLFHPQPQEQTKNKEEKNDTHAHTRHYTDSLKIPGLLLKVRERVGAPETELRWVFCVCFEDH